MSMTTWFAIVAGLAFLLTYLARYTHDVLLRLGAALCWLALLVYLLIGGDTSLDISDPWIQVLAFALLVMIIVPLTWQMKSDIKHEAQVRFGPKGPGGYPGASSESWTEWGPKRRKKGPPTTAERQLEYRRRLKGGK